MYRYPKWLAGLALASLPALAWSGELPASATLVRLGPQTVTILDFQANLERLPEHARRLAGADAKRNRSVVEGLLVTRAIAARARREGLDQDPLIQRRLELQAESFLATEYIARQRRAAVVPENLEARARELYLASQDVYRVPEKIQLQQIVVSLFGRTREMALARVREITARASAGEPFLDLAKEYSDDPGRARHGGHLGWITEKDFKPADMWPSARALKDGEVSAPLETPIGYTLLKRVGYRGPELLSFESVKQSIEAQEREKLVNASVDKIASEIRAAPNIEWNEEAMMALTQQLTPDEIRRLSNETAKQGAPGARR